MKTWSEIHEKISELMEKESNMTNPEEKQNICNQIDALLWVIGDNSGKPI